MRKGNEITGKVKCDECGKINQWYYHIPEPFTSGAFNVHLVDARKAGATLTQGTSIDPKQFKIYCKHCDANVFFDYKEA